MGLTCAGEGGDAAVDEDVLVRCLACVLLGALIRHREGARCGAQNAELRA